MTRILIADDHSLIREGLRSVFSAEPDLQVCGEAACAQDVLDLIESAKPDVLTLDFSMPGTSGFDLIKRVRQFRPELPVLVLTMHDEQAYGLRAMRAGANGYITKGGETVELLAAIRKVASGRPYVSAFLAEQLALNAMPGGSKANHDELSNREMQVLQLLVAGKTVTEIATNLNVSSKTISTHKARILARLKLQSVADLVRYAIEHRLT